MKKNIFKNRVNLYGNKNKIKLIYKCAFDKTKNRINYKITNYFIIRQQETCDLNIAIYFKILLYT